MKTLSIKAKLINCFFALTLVTGLCVPSIASAEPAQGTTTNLTTGTVAAQVEGVLTGGEQTDAVGADMDIDGQNENDSKITDLTQDEACSENLIDKSTEELIVETQSDQSVTRVTEVTDWADIAGSGFQVKSTSETPLSISDKADDGVDCYFSGNILHISSSQPIGIRNNPKNVSTTNTIQIDAGVQAEVTLAGVNIVVGNKESNAPINVVRSVTATTSLYLILADNSDNTLDASSNLSVTGAPAIRCGRGTELTIDDSALNIDVTTGKHVILQNGQIGTDATLIGGKTVKKGQPISVLDSEKPGYLLAKGGGFSAAIGGATREDAGYITINGGKIKAIGAGLKNETTSEGHGNTNGNFAAGAGIGGGYHGSGNTIVINSGDITAYAAWHGAGIGSGWSNGDPASKTNYGEKKADALYAESLRQSDGAAEIVKACGGNITINGGMVRSNGTGHGNAFGQGCGANNNGKTILITGGTLLCMAPTANDLTTQMCDIGGNGGYVVITGGSVGYTKPTWGKYTTNKNSIAFQGNGVASGQTAFAWGPGWKQDDASTHIDDNKVSPITIDLSAEFATATTKNMKITAWELQVGSVTYAYGAPDQFDNGKLYLWLPKSATESSITVVLSYQKEDGTTQTVDPLYRNPGQVDTLKRYINFEIPQEFFTDQHAQHSVIELPAGLKLPEGFKALEDNEASALVKPYDGLSFETADLSKVEIWSDEEIPKRLTKNDKVRYKYQVLDLSDPNNPKLGTESNSLTEMPKNAGVMAFTMESSEYADYVDKETGIDFSQSYHGHRATGWCQIEEVPAVVNLHTAEWGTLTKNADGKTWDWKATTSEDSEPGNRIKLDFDIRSALGTAVTCGIPTGSFQVLVDNVKVGDPISLTADAIKAEDGHTFVATESVYKDNRSANIEANNNNRNLINDRAKVAVEYYLDPTRIDGLLDVLESEATPEIQSEVQAMADSSEDITGVNNNSHKVTIQYIPAINYFEGTEEGFEEAASKPTTIIPVNNEPEVKDEDGTEITFNDESETSLVKNYSAFHGKNPDGTPDATKLPYFNLSFDSKSASPVTWTTSDPAVAEVMRYTEDDVNGAYKAGDVIYEETTTGELIPRIEVKSCGYTTLTMSQGSNAFYNGQKRIIHLTIIPDPAIVPQTEVRVVWENKTHPGLPAAPGDVLEYTVIGSNLTEGSSWQNVVLGDEFSKDLELVPDSVKLAKNFTTPDSLETLNAEDFSDVAFSDLASNKYKTTKDSITLNSDVVNSIYGGQSSAFKFQVKVKDNLTDRKTMTGDNPPTIPNTPTVEGNYGITETDKLVPGEIQGEIPKKLEGENATKVYPIEADEIPEAAVIPKDPILPGTDPTDPDNPSGDNKSDISVVKSAKNLTHPEGNKALVGDTIEYSITVENKGKDTCYYWPVIKDTLPTGLKPVAGSFELTKVDGTTIAVSDSCYQTSTHTISLYVDDLYGNEKTTLTFKCTVTPEAADIANTAQVIGTTPSDKWKGEHPDPIVEPDDDPETSYIKFDPNGGEGAPVGIEGQTSSSITAPFPTTEPKREGYEFVGWNTQANGCGLGITSYPSKFLSKSGSIYYYAQWKKATSDDPGIEPGDPTPEDPTSFSYIFFAANGGTNAPEGIKGKPGSTITDEFPKAIPTAPDGYEFVGWFTKKTGGDKVDKYPPQFLATTDADNTTKPTTTYYYAHWQKIGEPTDTNPPAGGDPDPTNPLEFTYIKFDANGGKFVTPVTAQAEGDTTTPTWSTDGLTGRPNGSISEDQKKTFPSKEYGPVERKGYTFTGWNTKADGTGEKVTAYGDTLPASGTTYYYAQWVKDPEPTWPPTPGQPFSPDPKIPASEYPWDDPDNPFDWDKYLEDTPKIDTPEPADVGKVMPADPDYKDLRITLSAKNETRMDGYTYVGDEVTYTILIENLSSPEKSWLDVIARADIPEGLKFIPGSIYLTTPQGEVIHVNDNAYNDVTRILALNAGDLAGGQTVKVVFKAEITIDAINKDIGMTSYAYGTLPSEFDVEDESYVKPELGTAFDPGIGGWALYDFNHKSISNPEKVYPSKYVTAQNPPLGTPEQQAEAAKLAKTGDTTALVALGVGVIAVAAGVALVVARRRMKKNGR